MASSNTARCCYVDVVFSVALQKHRNESLTARYFLIGCEQRRALVGEDGCIAPPLCSLRFCVLDVGSVLLQNSPLLRRCER